jgi:dTMP kinase
MDVTMSIISNFIVFEGGDGTGTSTQCERIREKFEQLDWKSQTNRSESFQEGFVAERSAKYITAQSNASCFITFEPTDGPIGKIIRSALKKDLMLQPETLARLFAADRNEHLYQSDGIVERCNRGEIVVSDRYIPSSLVYQGIECGEEFPAKLNKDFPLPELLFYFDIDPAIALERIGKRDFRECYEYLDFQVEVHKRYKKIISEYADAGVKVEIIDASKSIETISDEIWNSVKKILA